MFPRRIPATSRQQQGSIIVPAAVALLIGAILLGGMQLGYLFYAKRDMQKAADLAALTGAQILHTGALTECAQATNAASMAAQANTAGGIAASDLEVSCWRWDPVKNTTDPRHLAALQAGERYNAVRVSITRRVATMVPFMSDQALTVESVAAKPGNPVAAFSVGTTLLAAHKQPGNLINLLAAVGVNLDGTALVGYDAGLANVQITPAGLLKALGVTVDTDITVGQLNSLLAANVQGLNGLLDAVVTAGGRNELLAANVTLANALKAKFGINSLNVTLGSETPGRSPSLFANITAPDGKSVLNANINALDLITAAVSVATGNHAVQASAPIGIPGVLTITPDVRVIEPAQIAIGGVGTTAYSAQVRVFLEVQGPTINLLNGNLLAFGLDLPIVIDVSSAQGTLTGLCDTQDASGRDLATIQVQSSLLETCIGDLNATSAFSSSQPCSTNLANKQLLTLKLGGIDLGVNNKIALNPLPNGQVSVDLYEQQQATVSTNQLSLGTAVTQVVNAALTVLLGSSAQQGAAPGTSGQTGAAGKDLAKQLWAGARSSNTCNPDASDKAGYDCRNALWQSALKIGRDSSSGLGGYITQQPNPGLLTGLGTLLTNLTTGLGTVLNNVLGTLLPTNQCSTAILLGLGGYSGTAKGCINELTNTFSTPPPTNKPADAVLVVVGGLLSALQPILNGLGDSILALINNTLGLDLNSTDVRLMSLQCNGTGVQLVY
jgi:uncharacterized membrane protein